LIDSAIETSREVRATLEALGLERDRTDITFREFYVTDSPERFKRVGEKFLGQKIEHIKKIEVGN